MHDSLFTRGGLSLDRLRSFLAFAEAGSISKAAAGDVSRQALMSRQIRELEEFFGAELTVRRGKTIAPSPAGSRLEILIRGQFDDLERFQCDQKKQAKSFTFGAGASMLEWLVIPAAEKIRGLLANSTLRLSSQRSRELVENVRDGRLDFAIVREDAIPSGAAYLPLFRLQFHLCVSRKLYRQYPRTRLDDPATLSQLPFAANAGGGQLDTTFRQAMIETCGSFQPIFECDSLLQVRDLIVQGACAGLLPSIGTRDLAPHEVVTREFGPLKNYGRGLALHWNERQMRRRDVEDAVIKKIAGALSL
ncbi:LysR family transcriptional regulator [Prosthecobacter sp.]|uniref:LysR family transcriptional regulator n=1 Tax=Prosthecobacter sp. TaxID=1965333 RepID=UPI00248A2C96|nr:LysR family transcriptional regulator [Prosthecobacter sp.]MDI1315136.1 LysR family transcriptional regulator [Prosthecobacter sp.]